MLMKTVKVPLAKANDVKRSLIENDLLDKDYSYAKDESFIYFPVKGDVPGFEIVEKNLVKQDRETNLKNKLKGFSVEELSRLKTSYDIIGDIAILEIDDEFAAREKEIGKTLLDLQSGIHTVLKKAGMHDGEFRTQKMSYVAGEDKTETVHVENGVRLKLDVAQVYYSPRSSTERKRISEMVKESERVLVMFSGCGPFVFVISKNTSAEEVIGIEKNPIGHRYALDNLDINKARNVKLYEGDVREIIPKHLAEKKFDRILLPLPRSAEDFLDVALGASKKGTVIHFYDFLDESDIPKAALAKIADACNKAKVSFDTIRHVKCGQFSPGTFRVCVDFVIL